MARVSASILRVDAALRWSEADESSSEDVALACIEWLLAETNAYYRQHRLSSDAVCSVAAILRDNVVDSVLAATLANELSVGPERFSAEPQPTPELRDRHAARSVPLRSPGKTEAPSSPARAAAAAVMAAMSSSSAPSAQSPLCKIPKVMAEQTPARVRRRKRVEKDDASKGVASPVLPQMLDLSDEFPISGEPQDTRQWRLACLKDLEASKKKPGFTKWATVARAFTMGDSESTSTDSDVTLGLPQGQSSSGLAPLKLKSNVDSFSSIQDAQLSPESRRSTALGDLSVLPTDPEQTTPTTASARSIHPATVPKPKRTANSAAKTQRGTVVLNDTLSRHARPTTMQTSPPSSLLLPNSSSGGLWRYERRSSTASSVGSLTSSASVTPINDLTLDFATLANSPSAIASGVALARGDAILEGPERFDSPSNMSRKRFDLHQRLTMDYLLNGSKLTESSGLLSSSPTPSTSLTPARGSERQLVKNYIEEPAVPIELPPSFDPLLPDALAIPRTHLATSRSVPSLRVRAPTSFQSGDVAPDNSKVENKTSANKRRQRPSTAIDGQVLATLAGRDKGRASTSALVPGRSTYLREFPKPPKGVVIRASSTSPALADEALRVAWSS